MRASALGLLGAWLALSVSACGAPPQNKPQPLPTVDALAPQPLPSWIASVSPGGEVKSGAQILIRFKTDVVPVEQLEAADRSALAAHLHLDPPLPGRFTIWTPRMVGFAGEAPLPKASRFRVTLAAGLKDLKGNALGADYAWTFSTEPAALSAAGEGLSANASDDTQPLGLKPVLEIDSNVELDTASLLEHARVAPVDSGGAALELEQAPLPSPSPSSASAPGPAEADQTFAYRLVPKNELSLATKYRLTVSPGVVPLHGNLPSSDALASYFRTHGTLVLDGVAGYGTPLQGGGGRFVTGSPSLRFSNPLDEQSSLAALGVSPAPLPGVPLARLSDDGRAIELNGNALAPGTHYTLTVAASAKDAFGQTLEQTATETFDTGDLIPDIWAPQGLSIFPAGTDIALDLATTNLPERHYRSAFAPVDPKLLVTLDPSAMDAALNVLPPPEHWPLQPAVLRRNEAVANAVPLRAKLGAATGMLAYGATARTFRMPDDRGKLAWQQPRFTGFVQLTNVGAFAQWFPDGGMVRLARLSDGSPIAGANVEIYESLLDRIEKPNVDASQPPCATGKTGADGVWTLDRHAFARCASTATRDATAPELLVIAHDGKDWGFVRTQRWSDYAGVWTAWSSGVPNPRGTILSDRQLYQPGERAEFSAVGYFERDGTLERGRAASYAVSVTDPSGKTTALGSRGLDAFGAFAIGWPVPKQAPTGYYTIAAKASNGEALEGRFQVAQFKPPNFKVALALDAQTVSAGATVNAAATSTYLFGAPVEGGTTKFYVTRSRTYFTPKGWEAFDFGRMWLYPEEEPSLSSDVLQKDVTPDAAGKAALAVQAASDLPFATSYQVDAETTDASNLSVSASRAFTALPSAKLIGLRGEFLAQTGKAYTLGVIVSDPDGRALAGEHVHLILQRRESVSATQLIAGSETPRDAVHYVDVAQADVVSQTSPQTASLTPDRAGTYRIRANFEGAADEATASDALVWVTGSGTADWGPSEQSYLTVKLDKERYRPGDVATALIQSPYADADLFFAVVRHGVMYQRSQRVSGSAPKVSFTITPDMLPNAAVEAVLVRRGAPLAKGVPAGLDKLARIGFQGFDVALDAKYVNVKLSAAHPSLEPGATQRIDVRLRDAAGKPVRGEVVLAVVDDAVLQLSGYRFPDLVKIVYATQPVSTSFADNRRDVTLVTEKRSVDKGFGFGGGALAGPAGTRVRTLFKPLAYWNPALRTGADGTASVTFALPDDLTSWHVMALALATDARFGNGETGFLATKPLVTNPILPQFARPGDTFSAGVAVTDVARKGGTYAIRAELGGDLAFVDGNARSVEKTLTGQSDALNSAYRFDVLVTGPQDGRESVSTKLGGNADAFEVPVVVGSEDVTESAVQTGTTTAQAAVPLDVAPGLPASIGGLELTLASTLLADAVEPSRALDDPRPSFSVDLASRIAIAADSLELGRVYGIDAARAQRLRTIANGDLEALRTLALPDDGFAGWPGAKSSDLFGTAFVATQLRQAQLAGFAVSPDLARVSRFLAARLADPSELCAKDDRGCQTEARLEALETLVFLGEKRDDYLADIYARRNAFSYYEQVELARLLLALPDWRARGLQLRDKLLEQVNFSARNATVNTLGAFGESRSAGQAQLLSLLIESDAAGEDVDRALTSLLGMRNGGRWGCSCDDAEAMNALLLYARMQSTPPDFEALARVGPATFAAQFRGLRKTSAQETIAMTRLPKGRSEVRLSKTGTGTLHYVVALRYGVLSNAPGIYNGIRIDRFVRAAGSDAVLASFGLALPAAPASLAAAKVYDIEDRLTVDHDVRNVVVDDPLPGGLEAIDASFATSTHYYEPAESSWQLDYQAIYRDRVLGFAADLPAGVYAVHYLVRSVTPGDFIWPGARVSLQFAPEEFGRTAASRVTVVQAP